MASEKFGLLTFVLILVLGVLSRQYVARFTHVPYTVIMMLCGCIVGAVIARDQPTSGHLTSPTIRAWYNMDPEVLLFAFIPLLVFESAFMSDTHIFGRILWQILTLAGPGVLLASILTATVARFAFTNYDWSWPTCLMFGGILSATDPVAVVSLLKELGVSERLGTLIEGESLLNDGTAIVVFDVFFRAVEEDPCDPKMPTFRTVIELLFRLAFLGPVVGIGVGWVTTTMLGTVLNDPLNEIAITVLACYGSFGLAEGVIGTSGILSVVLCGVYLSHYGRGRISAYVEQAVHSFWSTISHFANTAGFFLAGLVMTVRVFRQSAKDALGNDTCLRCGDEELHGNVTERFRFLSETDEAEEEVRCRSFRAYDFWYLLILYVALHVIRGIVVVVSSPVLWQDVYGFDTAQASVVIYGGLRGAIGLALALIINETDGLEDRLKQRMLFQVSGIAIMTLLINGTTTRFLLSYLGLDTATVASDEIFAHVTVDIERKLTKETSRLKREPFLGDANWAMVWRYVPCLSADAYWRRIKDGRLLLSEPELHDVGSSHLSMTMTPRHATDSEEEPSKKATTVGALCAVRSSRYREYPVPPKLKGRWHDYHEKYGGQPPKFLHLPPTDDDDDAPNAVSMRHPIRASITSHIRNLSVTTETPRRRPFETFDLIFEAVGASAPDDHRKKRKTMQKFSLERAASTAIERSSTMGQIQRGLLRRRQVEDDDDDDDEQQPEEGVPTTRLPPVNTTPEVRRSKISSMLRRMMTHRASRNDSVGDWADVEMQRQGSLGRGSTTSDDDDRARTFIIEANLDLAVRAEARARIMYAVKANYNAAFARGRLSPTGLRVLREVADFQLDKTEKTLDGHWERLVEEYMCKVTTLEQMRILKIYVPVPLIRRFFDRFIFTKTAFVVEVAHNFVKALGDVDVNEIVDDGPDKIELKGEIETQRKLAQRTVDEYVKIFPDVANAVKTQIAAMFILVRMQRLVQELHEHGALNEKELDKASEKINVSRIKLAHHPTIELVPALETVLLKDLKVPFLEPMSSDCLAALLVDNTACRSEVVLADTIVTKKGKRKLERRGDVHSRKGWFVIARGAVQAIPAAAAGDDEDHHHKTTTTTADSDDVGEVLGEGSICCLEEQLLGIPMTATLKTLSMVHLVYFEAKAILAIADGNHDLRRKLYWTAAARVLRESPGTAHLPETDIVDLERSAHFVEIDDPDAASPESDAMIASSGEKQPSETSHRRRSSFTLRATSRRGSILRPAVPDDLVGKIHDLQVESLEKEVPVVATTTGGKKATTKDSPFCLHDDEVPAQATGFSETSEVPTVSTEKKTRFSVTMPRVFSSQTNLNAMEDDEKSGSAVSAYPPKKAEQMWSKLRGAVAGVSAIKKNLDAEVASLLKTADDYDVPPDHALLLLQGTAFLFDRDEKEDDDKRPLVVHSIAMITIDTHQSRKVCLSAGTKAFALKLDILQHPPMVEQLSSVMSL